MRFPIGAPSVMAAAFAVLAALIALVAGLVFGNLLVSPRRNL